MLPVVRHFFAVRRRAGWALYCGQIDPRNRHGENVLTISKFVSGPGGSGASGGLVLLQRHGHPLGHDDFLADAGGGLWRSAGFRGGVESSFAAPGSRPGPERSRDGPGAGAISSGVRDSGLGFGSIVPHDRDDAASRQPCRGGLEGAKGYRSASSPHADGHFHERESGSGRVCDRSGRGRPAHSFAGRSMGCLAATVSFLGSAGGEYAGGGSGIGSGISPSVGSS